MAFNRHKIKGSRQIPTDHEKKGDFHGTKSGGTAGDDIYAVADGIVTETTFEAAFGNIIVVDLGDGVTVKYGFLKEVKVSAGDEVKQGQVIATLGRSGMATGPNLLFGVTVDGEAVDPLIDSQGK